MATSPLWRTPVLGFSRIVLPSSSPMAILLVHLPEYIRALVCIYRQDRTATAADRYHRSIGVGPKRRRIMASVNSCLTRRRAVEREAFDLSDADHGWCSPHLLTVTTRAAEPVEADQSKSRSRISR